MSTLYRLECDLFEDQAEVWPDDLRYLPRKTIEHMLDALVEPLRRQLAVEPGFPPDKLSTIRETFRIVPVLEGAAAHRYLEEHEVAARRRQDWRDAQICLALRWELDGGRR